MPQRRNYQSGTGEHCTWTKLDKYMRRYTTGFDRGNRVRACREYEALTYQKRLVMRELKTATNDVERKVLVNRLKEIGQSPNPAMPCFTYGQKLQKRLKYVRYADDFLIGIIGSKEDAVKIKDDIKSVSLQTDWHWNYRTKTLVTHTEKPAKFLGYRVTVRKSNLQKTEQTGKPVPCVWKQKGQIKGNDRSNKEKIAGTRRAEIQLS